MASIVHDLNYLQTKAKRLQYISCFVQHLSKSSIIGGKRQPERRQNKVLIRKLSSATSWNLPDEWLTAARAAVRVEATIVCGGTEMADLMS